MNAREEEESQKCCLTMCHMRVLVSSLPEIHNCLCTRQYTNAYVVHMYECGQYCSNAGFLSANLKAIFHSVWSHCFAVLSGSSLFHLRPNAASLMGVAGCSQKCVRPVSSPNSNITRSQCPLLPSLQQGEELNHWTSAKTRFPGGVKCVLIHNSVSDAMGWTHMI